MEKQPTDQELSLRRQARRRLIGAIAFFIAIVVLLPMLLDSEPKLMGPQDIELRIPDKEKAGELMPGVNGALPSGTGTVVSAPMIDPIASAPVQTDVAAPETAASQGVESAMTVDKPVIRPSTGMQGEKKQPVPSPGYVVQAGAFSNAETAYQWQKKLSNQNIRAYTERAGDKTRVRAGPYATREEAENIFHRLQTLGLEPKISSAY